MPKKAPTIPENYNALIEEITEPPDWGSPEVEPKDSAAGQQILSLNPEEQRDFVLAFLVWYDHQQQTFTDDDEWLPDPENYDEVVDFFDWNRGIGRGFSFVSSLLKRRLPFAYEDVLTVLNWTVRGTGSCWTGPLIKVLENYLKTQPLTPELQNGIKRLITNLESHASQAEIRKHIATLRELGGYSQSPPLVAGEAWSDVALADIATMEKQMQSAWATLLNSCGLTKGTTPTAVWKKAAQQPLRIIGLPAFMQAVRKWFPLVDKPRTQPITSWREWDPDPNLLIQPINADILKGLVWLCAEEEDAELARALTALALSAYRKVLKIGPRCMRLGNACIWALGNMPGQEGARQLAILKTKIKFSSVQQQIEKVLVSAAQRLGLLESEIEEISVPSYGLDTVGQRCEQFGDYTAELVVTGTNTTTLQWIKTDGKRQKSAPQKVKEEYAEELKELSQTAKDLKKMIPAQRDRLERLYLTQQRWPLATWRERYLDHPLVGTLARRLIWHFKRGKRTASGMWQEGQLVDHSGRALEWLDAETHVELWHPLHSSTETVLAWRAWCMRHEVQQPFKQAHREIYVLTDAERETRTYSNRFAAHIVNQHQFHALCGARYWKDGLRLIWDGEYPAPLRTIPAWNLRAEFWVEGADDGAQTDTGMYRYLTTDQIRFYPIDAMSHYVYGGSGGYHGAEYNQAPEEALPLDTIPPLVFSEIMRDVDLFVGVASVGNDPTWQDGGTEGRTYWTDYAFGELSGDGKNSETGVRATPPASQDCRSMPTGGAVSIRPWRFANL